jgi:hypothetical protein
MKTIFIYVKRLPNGLFYLGKTEKNPYVYKGSGIRWKNSIKANNYTLKDIETWILHETKSKEDLKNMGIYYSRLFNVVSLEHWANLKEEDGDGGATSFGNSNPMRKYPELAKKIGTKKRGVKRLDITGPNALMKRPQIIEKFTGSNNYQAKKTYQYDKDNNLIKVWNYRNEAALALNINPSNISACCYGKRKYAGGYKWNYT